MISPFILGFAGTAAALWTHLILGAIIAVVATFGGWKSHKETHAHA